MAAASQTVQVIMTAKDLMTRQLKSGETRMKVLARVASRVLPIAISVAAGQMARMAAEAAKAALQIDRAAKSANLAVEDYQALAGTLQAAGIHSASLDKAMRTLNSQLGNALRGEQGSVRLFNQLGVEIRNLDGSAKDADTILREVSDALNVMQSESERAGLGAALLGRNFQQVKDILASGSEELDRFIAEAHAAGQVIDASLISGGAEAASALDNMGQASEAFGRELLLELAPAIKAVAGYVNELFQERALERFYEGNEKGLVGLKAILSQIEKVQTSRDRLSVFIEGLIPIQTESMREYKEAVAELDTAFERFGENLEGLELSGRNAEIVFNELQKTTAKLAAGLEGDALFAFQNDMLRMYQSAGLGFQPFDAPLEAGVYGRLVKLGKKVADMVLEQRIEAAGKAHDLLEKQETERLKRMRDLWERYYTGLRRTAAQAEGDQMVGLTAEREVLLATMKGQLDRLKDMGMEDELIAERRGLALVEIDRTINAKRSALLHQRRLEEIAHIDSMLQIYTGTAAEQRENQIGIFEAQLEAYDEYLDQLTEKTQRHTEILRQRDQTEAELMRLRQDKRYDDMQDEIQIADFSFKAAQNINRKGNEESKRQFKRRQVLEAGLATINTAAAAVAVMKNVTQAGGWSPLAIAEMGLILSAGFTQIRAINSAEFGGGGGTGATGGGASAIDTGAATGTAAGFTQNTVINITGGNFSDTQVRELIEAIGDEADRNGGRIGRLEVRG